MPDWLVIALTLLFFAHFAAFARLAVRRGGAYYLLVTALFAALTASFAVRFLAPAWSLGGVAVHLWLRYAAWAVAIVTVPMMVMRILARRRGPRMERR